MAGLESFPFLVETRRVGFLVRMWITPVHAYVQNTQ
jgi:hypothetical protein